MIYKLINEFWKLPAIVKGIRERIWENQDSYPHLTQSWRDAGLIDGFDLTTAGVEVVCCQDLLEYELSLVQDQVNYDKLKTIPENYDLLRSGLGDYFSIKLSTEWLGVIGKLGVKENWKVLDYGGGSGDYIKTFKGAYPETDCYLADKSDHHYPNYTFIPVNFREEPNWYLPYKEHFNIILLNEVLHLGEDIHNYLLQSAKAMLKPDTFLVIGEQVPTPRFDWRMATMTNNGKSLHVEQVKALAEKNNFGFVFTQFVSDSHYFMVLRK